MFNAVDHLLGDYPLAAAGPALLWLVAKATAFAITQDLMLSGPYMLELHGILEKTVQEYYDKKKQQ